MPDKADLSDDYVHLQLAAGLTAARKQAKRAMLVPRGTCFNCGCDIGDHALFCAPVSSGESECQIDYEHRERHRG